MLLTVQCQRAEVTYRGVTVGCRDAEGVAWYTGNEVSSACLWSSMMYSVVIATKLTKQTHSIVIATKLTTTNTQSCYCNQTTTNGIMLLQKPD